MRLGALGSFLRSGAVTWALALSGAVLGCATDVEPPATTTTTTTTASVGGGGGAGGAGGAGGGAGGEGGSNLCGEDCSKYETMPCHKSVCNEGQHLGPIGLCVVIYDDGAACDDGLFCTVNDVCTQGVCGGPDTNDCGMDAPTCQTVQCNEASDSCELAPDAMADGNPCISENLCEVLSKCNNGVCSGQPKDCSLSSLNECNTTACNPATGQCDPTVDPTKNGAPCSLSGDLCMVGKACDNGQCLGGSPKNCSAFGDSCSNGVCDPQSGDCMADPLPDGAPCVDYDSCTDGDTCTAAVCAGTAVAGCGVPLAAHNFEGGCPPAGWTLGGDWECGTPSNGGPAAPYSGMYCIATQIDGSYSNNQSYDTAIAQLPTVSVPAGGAFMRFRAWISTEGSIYDGVNIKASTNGGSTWSVVTAVTPPYNLPSVNAQPVWGGATFTAGSWQLFTVNLSAYAGSDVLLRFSFRSDSIVTYAGVYVDDIEIFDAALDPLRITNTAVPKALEGRPYTASVLRTGGTPNAVWSIVGETNGAWLTINPTTGVLSGTPAAGNLGPFSVTVRVEEPSLPSNHDVKVLSGQVIQGIWAESFEGPCPNGWTLGGDWECGAPTNVGPAAAYEGTQCIGTQIDASYNASQAWTTAIATSPAISLAGTTNPLLKLRMWNHTEGFSYDAANLKISTNGTTFTQVMNVTPAYNVTVSGEQGWGGDQSALGWQLVTADLSAYAGQTVYLRFAFRSDSIVQYPGVYIDDILIDE